MSPDNITQNDSLKANPIPSYVSLSHKTVHEWDGGKCCWFFKTGHINYS